MATAKKILTASVVNKLFTVLGISKEDVLTDKFFKANGDKDEMHNFILKGFVKDKQSVVINLYSSGNLIVMLTKEETDIDTGEVSWNTKSFISDIDEVKQVIASRNTSAKINVSDALGIATTA